MKTLLAIFGGHAASQATKDDNSRLFVLSLIGLLALVFSLAALTNFVIKRRKNKRNMVGKGK